MKKYIFQNHGAKIWGLENLGLWQRLNFFNENILNLCCVLFMYYHLIMDIFQMMEINKNDGEQKEMQEINEYSQENVVLEELSSFSFQNLPDPAIECIFKVS